MTKFTALIILLTISGLVILILSGLLYSLSEKCKGHVSEILDLQDKLDTVRKERNSLIDELSATKQRPIAIETFIQQPLILRTTFTIDKFTYDHIEADKQLDYMNRQMTESFLFELTKHKNIFDIQRTESAIGQDLIMYTASIRVLPYRGT